MDVLKIAQKIRGMSVDHGRYRDLDLRVFTHATFANPGDVIVVCGPTRVGKTTLKHSLVRNLIGSAVPNDDSLPVIDVEAATTHQGRFSTKHFTLRMLEELQDPVSCSPEMHIRRSQAETELRIQLERTLFYRKTKFVVLDEAHHFLRAPQNMSSADILDWIKCLGNRTGVVTVLFGGYDMLRFCFESGHLNGRSLLLDFGRYRPEGSDLEEFDRILLTFDIVLSSLSFRLSDHRDMIYEGSLGCYGLISSWVTAALADLASSSSRKLTAASFLRTRRPHQIAPILAEIEFGERFLASHAPAEPPRDKATPPSTGKRRPFTRRPYRDPVAGASS